MATKIEVDPKDQLQRQGRRPSWLGSRKFNFSWLTSWEIYLIIVIASLLRLYGINRTEFDGDQADIFQMARDAVLHGHLVATSNVASIGIYNPPGIIYFLMIPAAISANPLGAAILTAICAIASVILTYAFVRRYFGRLAATLGALLYATAAMPVFYSRFMWNQNALFLFVTIFIWILFLGVYEKRKGWLIAALPLIGFIFQLHGSGIILGIPLVVAIFLGWRTIRWYDVLFGLLLLALIYTPYMLWEATVNYKDIQTLFNTSNGKSVLDNQAWLLYQLYLSPYFGYFVGPKWSLDTFIPLLNNVRQGIIILVTVSVIASLLWALGAPLAKVSELRGTQKFAPVVRPFASLFYWWRSLCATPYCCGLLILVAWQLGMLYLLHHSINLSLHYFIIFSPGSYILLGIVLAAVIAWCKKWRLWGLGMRMALLAVAVLLIAVQLLTTGISVFDITHGHFADKDLSGYYNDLGSLQLATKNAEQVAQSYHVKHIYINADHPTYLAFQYLSRQMQTATNVTDGTCEVLPGVSSGPVVWLVAPYNTVNTVAGSQVAKIKFVQNSPHPGGLPFKIYLIQPVTTSSAARINMSHELQFAGSQPLQEHNQPPMVVTRWQFMQTRSVSDGQGYAYNIVNLPNSGAAPGGQDNCGITSMQAGDELLQVLPSSASPLNVVAQFEILKRTDIKVQLFGLFPLAFNTYNYDWDHWSTLQTPAGKESISVPTDRTY